MWAIGGLARHTTEDKKAKNIRTGHEFSESVGIIVSVTFQTFDPRMPRTLHQSIGAYFWPIGGLARHTSEDKQAQNIRTGHEFSKIVSITVLTTFQTFDLRMLRTLHSFSYFFKLLFICLYTFSYFVIPFPTFFLHVSYVAHSFFILFHSLSYLA